MNGGWEASRRENIASFVGDHETYHLLITSHTPLTERALKGHDMKKSPKGNIWAILGL